MSTASPFPRDVAVVGGMGHVGLPLAMTFADAGLETVVYDLNAKAIDEVRAGRMPFAEEGADKMLARVLASGKMTMRTTPELLAECRFVVVIIGTPVDEHLNPTFTAIYRAVDACIPHLRDGQILILRSTVFPGMSRRIQDYIRGKGVKVDVAFCPERVAQGHSLREFRELPQIVGAFDDAALQEVKALFGKFVPEIVEMKPMEAELTKLMTNAWRYIQFATVNQFYMVAEDNGLDFDRILHGCRHNYPRMAGMPGPGLAAGPCLVKDTMQLAAYSGNSFVLGHAAMLINEGLPAFLIKQAAEKIDLSKSTAGILGLAFKGDSDDPRDSLAYKLRKLLTMEAKAVLSTDPYVDDKHKVPLERVLAESDVLFVATPHKAYKKLTVPAGKVVVDIWSCVGVAA